MINNHDYNENKKLLQDILERNYYSLFRQGKNRFEIFLKAICPNNCDYCYLAKYHNQLYPNKLHNNEQILKNFESIIKWYIQNKFTCEIDIFSGEWITTDLFKPILEILYTNFKNITPAYLPKFIMIPDSMKFINNEQLTNEVQNYIYKFKKIYLPLYFSASIDGKYCDLNYSQTEEEKNQFYYRTQHFLELNNFGIHPMVSSTNIPYWIDNFEWIKEKFSSNYAYKKTFLLEVRDESWTTDTIQQYLNFLNYLIDDKFNNQFKQNKQKFFDYIFKINDYSQDNLSQLIQLNNYKLFFNTDRMPCSIQQTLCIRAGDLSFGLCHRLFYDELIIGKYLLDSNNNIIDIEEKNVALQILKDHIKKSCFPICEKCPLVGICCGPCLGNCYENFKNPLVPPEPVCNLLKSKYMFLIYKYKNMGILDLLHNDNKIPQDFKEYILDLAQINI